MIIPICSRHSTNIWWFIKGYSECKTRLPPHVTNFKGRSPYRLQKESTELSHNNELDMGLKYIFLKTVQVEKGTQRSTTHTHISIKRTDLWSEDELLIEAPAITAPGGRGWWWVHLGWHLGGWGRTRSERSSRMDVSHCPSSHSGDSHRLLWTSNESCWNFLIETKIFHRIPEDSWDSMKFVRNLCSRLKCPAGVWQLMEALNSQREWVWTNLSSDTFKNMMKEIGRAGQMTHFWALREQCDVSVETCKELSTSIFFLKNHSMDAHTC